MPTPSFVADRIRFGLADNAPDIPLADCPTFDEDRVCLVI